MTLAEGYLLQGFLCNERALADFLKTPGFIDRMNS